MAENQDLMARQGILGQQTDLENSALNNDLAVSAQMAGIDESTFSGVMQSSNIQALLNDAEFGRNMNVSQARLAQELGALGLAKGQIDQFMQAFENQQKRRIEQENQMRLAHDSSNEQARKWVYGGMGGGTPSA